MSIPKVLHYCWFGGAPKPKNIQNCIRSWKKYCPDYEIIEWNEQNFDVSQSLYTRQAYDARRWAFVADYARLKILYEQGGIYMDTDVELLRPLDDLLAYPAFFGFQHNNEVATGLGFGAEARSPVVKALLDDYDSLPFLLPDGSVYAAYRGTDMTIVGWQEDFNMSFLSAVPARQSTPEMEVFPVEYFCPVAYAGSTCDITPNTYSIHHYHSSWKEKSRAMRFDEEVMEPLLGAKFYYRYYRPFRRALGARRKKWRT